MQSYEISDNGRYDFKISKKRKDGKRLNVYAVMLVELDTHRWLNKFVFTV